MFALAPSPRREPLAVRAPTLPPPPPASQTVSTSSEVKEVKKVPEKISGTRTETKVHICP